MGWGGLRGKENAWCQGKWVVSLESLGVWWQAGSSDGDERMGCEPRVCVVKWGWLMRCRVTGEKAGAAKREGRRSEVWVSAAAMPHDFCPLVLPTHMP